MYPCGENGEVNALVQQDYKSKETPSRYIH